MEYGGNGAVPYNSCPDQSRRGLIFPPRNGIFLCNGGTGDPAPTHRQTVGNVGVGLPDDPQNKGAVATDTVSIIYRKKSWLFCKITIDFLTEKE